MLDRIYRGHGSAVTGAGPDVTRRDDLMSKLSEQRPLQQRTTLAVYLGTAAVAVLTLGAAHLADAAALTAQRDTLALLDLVREQQGLAQRITFLSARGIEGDPALDFQRGQLTHRFARNHDALRQAVPELGVSASSAAAFRALYAEGNRPLATQVQTFLDRVRTADTGAPKDRSGEARMIAEFAGETFPNRLDALAKAFLRTNTGRVDALRMTGTVLAGLSLLSLLVQGLSVAWPLWRRLGRHDEMVTAVGVTDPATGALTAQSFASRAVGEIQRARRYRRPVSVMTIATTLPTLTIDAQVLRTLYGHLSETLRPSDLIGLHDGGSFSVILPETDLYAAELAGQRILREFDLRPIWVHGQAVIADVRIGVAQVRTDESSPEVPLARAAAALREARSADGDRVALSAQREPRSAAL